MEDTLKSVIMAVVMLFAVMVLIFVLDNKGKGIESETKRQTYSIANDGGYVPTYHNICEAKRLGNEVYVTWKGNEYSAYLSPESEIQTGDKIMCTFIIYEGNVELVAIN